MIRILLTIGLLICSNVFMTYAWYYHLKRPAWPLLVAIVVSWGIAFLEYTLQVPANRIGSERYGGPLSTPQLKIIQEAITLCVFSVFSIAVMKEKLRPTDIAAFVLIFAAVVVSYLGRPTGAKAETSGPVEAASP